MDDRVDARVNARVDGWTPDDGGEIDATRSIAA